MGLPSRDRPIGVALGPHMRTNIAVAMALPEDRLSLLLLGHRGRDAWREGKDRTCPAAPNSGSGSHPGATVSSSLTSGRTPAITDGTGRPNSRRKSITWPRPTRRLRTIQEGVRIGSASATLSAAVLRRIDRSRGRPSRRPDASGPWGRPEPRGSHAPRSTSRRKQPEPACGPWFSGSSHPRRAAGRALLLTEDRLRCRLSGVDRGHLGSVGSSGPTSGERHWPSWRAAGNGSLASSGAGFQLAGWPDERRGHGLGIARRERVPPIVASNANGRLEVFAIGADGALWHVFRQTAPSGQEWSDWASFGGAFDPTGDVGLIRPRP